MTDIEIVEKAIELLKDLNLVTLKISQINKSIYDYGGVCVEVEYLDKDNEHRKTSFTFLKNWFDINETTMVDQKCGIEKVSNVKDKLILRIAYYLYNVWYKSRPNVKKK